MIKKTLGFLITIFLVFNYALAVKPASTEWGIQYRMNPENPGPGDYVMLDIYSYSMDLDSSNISYIVNGKLEKGGTGEKNFIFKVPKNNRSLKLEIIAKDFKGKVQKKNIIIKPVSLDLIYEVVNPYRPIFYKGKSVALSHGAVKFFAFPNFINSQGKRLDPKSLIYTWKINGNVQAGKSGIGKTSFIINKIYGVPRKTKVDVVVRSLDGTMMASKTEILNPGRTKIDFYVDNKVMPFKFKSVANPNLVSNFLDADIVAIPYFFNDVNISEVNWVINNNKINLLSDADDLRMTMVGSDGIIDNIFKIRLSINNMNRPLQAALGRTTFSWSDSLKNIYEEKEKNKKVEEESSSFFGL